MVHLGNASILRGADYTGEDPLKIWEGPSDGLLSWKLETGAMLGDGRTAMYAVNCKLEAVDCKAWLGRISRLCPKLEAGNWKAWHGRISRLYPKLETGNWKAWHGRASRLCSILETGRWKLEGMARQSL